MQIEISRKKKTLRSYLTKLEPFFEHIVIGGLYLLLGYLIKQQFNESIIGFLGIAAYCWGGFNIFLGVFIYGVTIYAHFTNPEHFEAVKQRNTVARVNKRILKDLARNDVRQAIARVHGLLSNYPNVLELRFFVGRLYLKIKDYSKAGEYLYLKHAPLMDDEQKAVDSFRKRMGNDPFQILRRQVKNGNLRDEFFFDPEEENPKVMFRTFESVAFLKKIKGEVSALVKEIDRPNELNSTLVRQIKWAFVEMEKPFYVKWWERDKSTVINIAVLVVGLIGVSFL